MKVLRTIHNCHALGLHSLLIHRDPVIRIFVCDEAHTMYRNGLGDGVGADRFLEQSVGFHRHGFDITLIRLSGTIWNVLGFEMPPSAPAYPGRNPFQRCRYQSAIQNGQGSLWSTGQSTRLLVDYRRLEFLNAQCMNAWALHTVAVPAGESASWIVVEHKSENPPTGDDLDIFTTNPTFDSSGMYVEGNEASTKRHLKLCGGLPYVENVLTHFNLIPTETP